MVDITVESSLLQQVSNFKYLGVRVNISSGGTIEWELYSSRSNSMVPSLEMLAPKIFKVTDLLQKRARAFNSNVNHTFSFLHVWLLCCVFTNVHNSSFLHTISISSYSKSFRRLQSIEQYMEELKYPDKHQDPDL